MPEPYLFSASEQVNPKLWAVANRPAFEEWTKQGGVVGGKCEEYCPECLGCALHVRCDFHPKPCESPPWDEWPARLASWWLPNRDRSRRKTGPLAPAADGWPNVDSPANDSDVPSYDPAALPVFRGPPPLLARRSALARDHRATAKHPEGWFLPGAGTPPRPFPTAPQQMSQAALVQGLEKLPINAPPVAHQKTVKIFSQHGSGLLEPAARLNRIDRYLRGAESPHPPELSVDSPTGLVRSDTRASANFFDQRLIGRCCLTGYPGQGLAQTASTHLQPEGLLEHRGRFAVGQSQTFIQLRGQGQRSGAQLRGRTAHRIRGLPGMPPLHPPPTMSAATHVNAKFNALYPRFRDLGLKLGHRLAFLELPPASRTPRGQGHLDHLIHLFGNGPTRGASVLLSWFASGFFGSGLGILPRERSGLSLTNRSII